MVPSGGATEKIPSDSTVRLAAQYLNHFATPGPLLVYTVTNVHLSNGLKFGQVIVFISFRILNLK